MSRLAKKEVDVEAEPPLSYCSTACEECAHVVTWEMRTLVSQVRRKKEFYI